MKQGEPEWVRRAAGGDRMAFATLIEAHWADLVGLARSVVGEATAEDAVQDALISAWSKLGSLRDATAFSGWLTRIVLRQCLRRKRRWRDLLPIHSAAADSRAPEFRAPEASEINLHAELDLERCLKALAPRQRAVIYMTVVEGRTESEIAELMQISAASVRSHRRRARQSLDRFLNGAQHAS